MRLLLLMLVGVLLYGAGDPVALDEKFAKSEKCMTCHRSIVQDWQNSWHRMSHYGSNEYFQKTLDYMARKMRTKSLDTLKVECATCHNPRISVTKTTVHDEINAVMGLDKNSKVTPIQVVSATHHQAAE